MTTASDPFAAYRPVLTANLERTLDGVTLSHAALLRQQLASAEASDLELAPSLLCLLITEALGGSAATATSAATSLALLSLMARDFDDIRDGGPSGTLQATWGQPRALNAGDGFYALAQTSSLRPATDAALQTKTLQRLDTAARELSQELLDAAGGASRPSLSPGLCAAAAAIAGVCAGSADPNALAAFGRQIASADNALQVPASLFTSEPARATLGEALAYVRKMVRS